VLIKGGLGNQLFQLAFALSLRTLGLNIAYLVLDYDHDTYGREPYLQYLDIPFQVIKRSEYALKFGDSIREISETMYASVSFDTLHEYGLTNSLLLSGYWQNVTYLNRSNIENYLPNSLYALSPLLALHVRRVDYAHHGLLPAKYYEEILDLNYQKKFIVFSDEPNMTKAFFSKFENFLCISSEINKIFKLVRPLNPLEEFILLSSHESIAMANSSFSWIAAFIAHKRRDAKVFFPSHWSLLTNNPNISNSEWNNWKRINTTLVSFL
jgi:hypothetical protein